MAKTYRVKTAAEFRKEFGNKWREKTFWEGSDKALGQVLPAEDVKYTLATESEAYNQGLFAHTIEFTVDGKMVQANICALDIVEVPNRKHFPSMLTHVVGAH